MTNPAGLATARGSPERERVRDRLPASLWVPVGDAAELERVEAVEIGIVGEVKERSGHTE